MTGTSPITATSGRIKFLGLRKYGEAAERVAATCPYSWDEICWQGSYPVFPKK